MNASAAGGVCWDLSLCLLSIGTGQHVSFRHVEDHQEPDTAAVLRGRGDLTFLPHRQTVGAATGLI
jgi:hypothetical protein